MGWMAMAGLSYRMLQKTMEKLYENGGFMGLDGIYPLVNVYISMKHHHVQWENIHYFDWAILNSYVRLPEGIVSSSSRLAAIQEKSTCLGGESWVCQ